MGCTKVSAGCQHCYADSLARRYQGPLGIWGKTGTRVVAADSTWAKPLAWDRKAKANGEWHRVFCASLADVFEAPDTMPSLDVFTIRRARLQLLALIDNTPNLDWLLLTKRPERVIELLTDLRDATDLSMLPRTRDLLREWVGGEPPANVWIGTSVEDQATADERIPRLIQIPARIRFLSMEPLLGPVAIDECRYVVPSDRSASSVALNHTLMGGQRLHLVDWVIVGGESGPNARPMAPDWARMIRNQCRSAGVSFFFKQWGDWIGGDQRSASGSLVGGVTWHDWGNGQMSVKLSKKLAGRTLDGVIHDGYPASLEVNHA